MMVFSLIIGIAILVVLSGLWLFRRLGLLDRPGPDIIPQRKPVPNLQGFFLMLGFVLMVGIIYPEYFADNTFLGLLGGGMLIGSVAYLDTVLELRKKTNRGILPFYRLIFQILAALIAFYVGGVSLNTIEFSGITYQLPHYLTLFITVLWFLGFINAVNWIDGINGLAIGVSSIGFFTIYLLINFVVFSHYVISNSGLYNDLMMVSNITFLLGIFSLLYLIVEWKPYGLLRDSGIMFASFCLAYLALLGGAKIGTLIVTLSLVIFDAIWVFINRVFVMKKNPLKGDYTHLHYRLLALGWNRTEVRVFILSWTIFFMLLMLLQGDNRMSKFIIFLLMAIIFFSVNIYLFRIKKLPGEYKTPLMNKE